MGGFFSILTREDDLKKYGKGVFLATADPRLVSNVLSLVRSQLPNANFTYIAPESYRDLICFPGETICFEELKHSPLRSLRRLRSKRFDACVSVFAGGPAFRKWKLVPFLLNVRRIVVCNESGDSFPLDRAHWRNLYRHLKLRRQQWPNSSLLFVPFGFCFLLARTAWLIGRARLHKRSGYTEDLIVAKPGLEK